MERVRPEFGVSAPGILKLQRSRSWWSESGQISPPFIRHFVVASTKSLLVERVRLSCARWRFSVHCSFNEVAPGGASQAGEAHGLLGVVGRASTKSLLVERVRQSDRYFIDPDGMLQRSRSWWSESGDRDFLRWYVVIAASTKSLLVERVRRAVKPVEGRLSCLASTKSLLVERVRPCIAQRLRQLALASTKSLLVERVRQNVL